jgi:hypothetical protein
MSQQTFPLLTGGLLTLSPPGLFAFENLCCFQKLYGFTSSIERNIFYIFLIFFLYFADSGQEWPSPAVNSNSPRNKILATYF